VIIVDQSIELVDQLAKPAMAAVIEPENDPGQIGDLRLVPSSPNPSTLLCISSRSSSTVTRDVLRLSRTFVMRLSG